jgi:hypothetical protein
VVRATLEGSVDEILRVRAEKNERIAEDVHRTGDIEHVAVENRAVRHLAGVDREECQVAPRTAARDTARPATATRPSASDVSHRELARSGMSGGAGL